MDVRYPAFCLADPRFYDSPDRLRPDAGQLDYRTLVDTPPGWELVAAGPWTHLRPPPDAAPLPAQGWKIHVSATLDNAAELLEKVTAYCFRHVIAVKFLPNSLVLQARNGKYAPREGSGKFLTLYPRDVEELRRTLVDLDAAIGGSPGPYILSDLRWNEGPLYVRYGGFTLRHVYGQDGTRTPAVERPDGVLVPDHREPRFTVPEWVEMPDFLAPSATPRISREQPEEFPYEMLSALHFSNGGGVYRVRRFHDRAELVLKEGRPHAGLDRLGRDAPARLRLEHAVLVDLKGIAGIPLAHDYHLLGGHEFLAMDHVPGISLQTWVTLNYPSPDNPGEHGSAAEYAATVEHILERLERTVRAVHARGYLFNDLHPGNVLIDDELNVSLIDFEAAQPQGTPGPRPLGAPGFAAPDVLRGEAADLYSLNAIRLFLYLPLNSLLALCPAKAHVLVAKAQQRLGLPDDVVRPLTRALTVAVEPASGLRPPDARLAFTEVAGSWERHTSALTASIRAGATLDRRDRLFPGDINQFFHGGGGMAFGAAGVIDTLYTAGVGAGELAGAADWLERDLGAGREPRLGLYDGAAGICHVLYNLGRTDTALAFHDRCLIHAPQVYGIKLFDGLAGIGLSSLDFHRRTGDPNLLEHAEQSAATVETAVGQGVFGVGEHAAAAGSLLRDRTGNAVDNFSGGLMYGWTGPALFLLRMFEVTGRRRWLQAAVAALHRDLDQCRSLPDGSLQVRNGGRVLPYLATGSAGVALVGDLILGHEHDDRIAAAVPSLALACADDVCVGAGLFNGRAGLVGALRESGARPDRGHLAERVDAGVAALDLYALADEHGLVFPGEQNLRASLDLATGSAGVLRLINVLAGRTAELLPFLGSASWANAHPELSAEVPDTTGHRFEDTITAISGGR
ncbi:class III lanthionine synthetase LanKC [Embleya sp. NPDC127516]|uniref:class III lanthionine synthetase LanKC n=1 Tax=Embleya sp. NPDC127516 TaxID=3363990 RepID=UPI00380864DB